MASPIAPRRILIVEDHADTADTWPRSCGTWAIGSTSPARGMRASWPRS